MSTGWIQGPAAPRGLPAGAPVSGERGRTDPCQPPSPIARRPATILVVDDEPRMRRVARRMLSELGYQVTEAENASDATHLLEQGVGVDLLFTDVVMPGAMDGRALAGWARQHRPGLKVLLTSGLSLPAPGEGASGGDRLPFLKKPYSKDQLQGAVQTLL
jgi:two-component system, NtrC family, sensor kinase